ncbi:hypothetical protein B5C26_11220 [Photorhabdus luminescens]|nr:hypothetical protein B5C26_11220 [Photorhabdus luminescens]
MGGKNLPFRLLTFNVSIITAEFLSMIKRVLKKVVFACQYDFKIWKKGQMYCEKIDKNFNH